LRSLRRAPRSLVLAILMPVLIGQLGCIPDKPLEDPTPVGARPNATAPTGASPGVGASPVAGGGSFASPTALSTGQAPTGKIGEPLKSGDVTVTVNKVDRTESQVIVNLTTENTGQGDLFIQPSVDFSVQYGSAGTVAPPQAFGVPPPRYNGDLKRGQKSAGNVAFQVPRDASNLVFIWKAPQGQGGRVLATLELRQS
jgi:hypothetical protein